jgi:hypothetical protein
MLKQKHGRRRHALSIAAGAAALFLVLFLTHCSGKKSGWKPVPGPLTTRWTDKVSPANALPMYPRPQMVRKRWKNLNGLWDLAVLNKEDGIPDSYSGKILVPFPVESALSGVGQRISKEQKIWYRRRMLIPKNWKDHRILLHFGASDWETTVWIDGKQVGGHRGGYDAFRFDITGFVKPGAEHELVVSVWDPTDQGGQPAGKQRLNPRGIFYTPSSGIWQTVWLEPVSSAHVEEFRLTPDPDQGALRLSVKAAGETEKARIHAAAFEKGKKVAEMTGPAGSPLRLSIPHVRLWSPDDPFLYDLKISLLDADGRPVDRIDSYFAMRNIRLGKDEKGVTRLLLNGRFVFQLGPLDQGFWPDGLYTAPTDDALRYDIEMMKKMGFNMVRKHVKVEPARWYSWCDKLGLLVWQDMPSAGNTTAEDRNQFEKELERMILGLANHPSIIMWVPFNEGWGQYDSPRITQWIRKLDASRLVDHASGWTDMGVGDVHDIHSYPEPLSPEPEPARAAVLGEFGGLGFNVSGHAWNPEGWGYDLLPDSESLTQRYENLFLQLYPLIQDPGLSAAVYTQITDIESENNGLMTYDRSIVKIDPGVQILAHQGYLAPVMVYQADIFIGETDLVLRSRRPGAEIHYTLDGSEPTRKSPHYDNPVRLTNTTVIRARSYWDNTVSSRIGTYTLTRTLPKKSIQETGQKPGLACSCYEGEWDTLPGFSELKPCKTTISKTFGIDTVPQDRYFSLRLEGFISVPETGIYIFYCMSDDGSRLFIGEDQIVDNDGLHGAREKYGAVALEAGMHPVTLLYFQKAGGRSLEVGYEGPGFGKKEVPAEVLFH